MALQSIEFFVDVDLGSEKRKLDLEARGVRFDVETGKPLFLFYARCSKHLGHAGSHRLRNGLYFAAARLEHCGNSSALTRAHLANGGQRLVEQRARLVNQWFDVDLRLLYHPGPPQDVDRVNGCDVG